MSSISLAQKEINIRVNIPSYFYDQTSDESELSITSKDSTYTLVNTDSSFIQKIIIDSSIDVLSINLYQFINRQHQHTDPCYINYGKNYIGSGHAINKLLDDGDTISLGVGLSSINCRVENRVYHFPKNSIRIDSLYQSEEYDFQSLYCRFKGILKTNYKIEVCYFGSNGETDVEKLKKRRILAIKKYLSNEIQIPKNRIVITECEEYHAFNQNLNYVQFSIR